MDGEGEMEDKGQVEERQAVGGWSQWSSERGSRWGREIDGGEGGQRPTEAGS